MRWRIGGVHQIVDSRTQSLEQCINRFGCCATCRARHIESRRLLSGNYDEDVGGELGDRSEEF